MKRLLKNMVLYFDDHIEQMMICIGVLWCANILIGMFIDWGVLLTMAFILSLVGALLGSIGLGIIILFLYEKLLAWACDKGEK